jgi:parvulin-like peptidyl-prolyl isomerase
MVGQIRRASWDVNPGKIREYYEKNKADFARKEQVKLRQITITQGAAEKPAETAARAAAWADALRHPEKIAATLERFKVAGKPIVGTPTFADVAMRVSTDDFASKGGDAGWRNLDDLNATVTTSLKTLKVGEVSEPLKFDVGAAPIYVIVSREGERPKGYADVNDPEVMSEIEGKVRQIGMKTAIQNWLNDLRTKHHVQFR